MTNALLINVRQVGPCSDYDGHRVYLQGKLVYWRPYDGSSSDDVVEEFAETLGELIREKLNYKADKPEEEEYW